MQDRVEFCLQLLHILFPLSQQIQIKKRKIGKKDKELHMCLDHDKMNIIVTVHAPSTKPIDDPDVILPLLHIQFSSPMPLHLFSHMYTAMNNRIRYLYASATAPYDSKMGEWLRILQADPISSSDRMARQPKLCAGIDGYQLELLGEFIGVCNEKIEVRYAVAGDIIILCNILLYCIYISVCML